MKSKKFRIGKEIYEFDPESLIINTDDIENELRNHPYIFQLATYTYAKAVMRTQRRKIKLDLSEATMASKFRKEGIEGVNKVTEGAIKNAILEHPEYQNEKEELLRAEDDETVLKGIVRAFEARTSMLLSLGSMLRHHVEQEDLSIKEERYRKQKKGRG